jgi:effector-binding domain-containing protein
MIDEPEIIRMEEQPTAVIRLEVPRSEIQNVLGTAIGELMGALEVQGVPPTGSVFSHHLRTDDDVFDLEVGLPIAGEVAPMGRVRSSLLPAGRVARTVYRGSYEGLGDAWGAFDAWIAEAGHEAETHMWESYVAGPESGAEASEWRTELFRPLRDAT